MRWTLALAALLALPASLAVADTKVKQLQKPTEVGKLDQAGAYQLSSEEQGFDCKKLTGRMQVRILQLRSQANAAPTSAAARSLHSTIAPIAKGNSRGADPAADNAFDRAMLEAYNRQLVAKDCRSYDLQAALKPGPISATDLPSPTIPPKGTAAKKDKKPKFDLTKALNRAGEIGKAAAAAAKPKPAQPASAPSAGAGWSATTTAPSGAGK